LHTISQTDLERASLWVDINVGDPLIQTILSESLDQSKNILFNTQVSLDDGDCAIVFRSWGNELYMSPNEDSETNRLKLAVAIRSLASRKDEPQLWEYLSCFEGNSSLENLMEKLKAPPLEQLEPTMPQFEVIIGGKK